MNPLEKPPFDQPAVRASSARFAVESFTRTYKLKREIRAIDKEIHAILKAELTRAKSGEIPFQP